MADSLLDIGAEPIFPFDPNWAESPRQDFVITRYLHGYPGTASQIEEMNPEVPIQITASFDFANKVDEKTFLEFIHTSRGRNVRFWVKQPKQAFAVKNALSSGSAQVVCHEDFSNLSYQGYERIYFLMSNGDLVTRHVTAVVHDANNEEVQLTLATVFDRDAEVSEVVLVGRLLLVRFDDDNFRFNINNDRNCSLTQRFVELVKEYSELAANP